MSTNGGKPTTAPATPFKDGPDPLHRLGNWLWVPLKGEWRDVAERPEEVVRQQFVHRLLTEYGYALSQMAQERRTTHGHKSPRADIVVCRDADALRENRDYALVVECKSEDTKIVPDDYDQGESYARAVGCEFLVLHNARETRFLRLVPGAPGSRIDIEDIPNAMEVTDPARLEAIRRASKAFSREEFRRLLSECHDILRDNHKLEPGQAFDEISKILFVKMWVERTGVHERFTEDFLNGYAKYRGRRVEEVMDDLFDDTKVLSGK
jgi:type I restriction enzyme M protein